MPALSDRDKERCRYHLWYLNTSFTASITMGVPRPVQTLFLVEDAMGLLASPEAVNRVTCILDTMDALEGQLRSAVPSLAASRLGELELHPLKSQGVLFTDSIDKEYKRWGARLADILGVPFYPFSRRYMVSGPGSNVPVRG